MAARCGRRRFDAILKRIFFTIVTRAREPKQFLACSLRSRLEGRMQRKFMPTDVFLRLEKEWQHMRHAKHNLEIEAVPANDQRPDCINELEPASAPRSAHRR
ncbi:hypothetical protein GOC90_01965 [Sinorhizobium medicae]|nr:hypothetical protein [Sinorhizobium medicae]MDX0587624.1 hypothetical protein [Sinorhizobium medicae]MDX0593993.1 hypothetical protein [Sinorhizobium medicae]MDX0606236.1 hypothetical protein [Sinorhizobium medicae]MDX0643337.1 hypothetical protein [Sinorhizobium medicae]